MTMKRCYATSTDGIMKLPDEVLEILPQGIQIHMYTDSEKGIVTMFAENPADLPTKWFFEGMAELMADENADEYFKPVPAELMRRPRKKDGE